MTNKMFKKIIVFLVFIVLAIILNFRFDIIDNYDINQLRQFNDWIQGWGWLAPVLFIIIYGFSQIMFLPNPFFMIVSGLAFGPIQGIIVVIGGFSLGASLSFFIARYLAKSTVEYWLEKKDLATKINQWFNQHGYHLLIITRSIPIIPINLQNYAYGITKIDYITYISLSIVSTMPKVIFLAGISGLLIEADFRGIIEEQILALLGILLLVAIMYFIIYKFFWIEEIEFE